MQTSLPSFIFFPEVVLWSFFSILGLEDISTPLGEKLKPLAFPE